MSEERAETLAPGEASPPPPLLVCSMSISVLAVLAWGVLLFVRRDRAR